MKHLINILVILFSLNISSCKTSKIIQPLSSNDLGPEIGRPKSSLAYQRDSVYLHYTAEEWKKRRRYPFEVSPLYPMPHEKIKIWIDSIFYSPDSLKIMAFLIKQVPNNEGYKSQRGNHYYSGTSFAGFRDSINEPWEVYGFHQYMPVGWDTYKQVHQLFRAYYLGKGKFKNDFQYILSDNGEWIDGYFKFNLDEPEFWSKSVVWQKGARIPGYYNFQVRGNYGPKDIKTAIVKPQEVDYPQYILEMFK